MRLRRVVWIALTLAALASAQPATSTENVPRMIPVHYVNVDRLRDLVSVPGVSVKSDTGMSVLVVTGRPDAVAAIEEMVKKLDVPPPAQPEFELTGYLVSGSLQSRADEVPGDLAPAVKQLHGLFAYKSYKVIDTFYVRGGASRQSTPSASGVLPGTNSQYDFNSSDVRVSGTTVHFNDLHLVIETPTNERNKEGRIIYRNMGIKTSIDVPEGQKIVVGKSSVPGGDDALILVLSVKIVK
jgi:hypothetical protein